ncbi:hypothetical protein [Alicyclobacillus dauci]|uniref:DUF4367 domain-containing protein n=1 Tax=Alicyclobacillus dauci TaxID=1475485 RepID=A0ABY6YZN9_9BACL|nr:hypothetical protein [Alicyclobacillus dauci]WAH36046.1 hypothetical protein NZD86_17560 [Alicyclobacillus dauci]
MSPSASTEFTPIIWTQLRLQIRIYKRSMLVVSVVGAMFLLYGCSTNTVQNETANSISEVPNPPYKYSNLMGFQPVLPREHFQLNQSGVYVFKYVNPPWGKVDPRVMETWGNDTAFDVTYNASDGTGKSFIIMETAIDSSNPPRIGTVAWQSVQENGQTFYKHDVPGYRIGIAMIDKGILYLVATNSGFKATQLEQILQSLNVPVRTAPDLIKTQTFGFPKARSAVPFTALVPKTVPFKWDTQSAVGEDVKTYQGSHKQNTGRFTLTYAHGSTQLKIIESVGMKYVNPNIAKAENGVKVTLNDGTQAVYINGGSAVSFVDGGSSNRNAITWTTTSGVNMVIVGPMNLTQNDLVQVANSLVKPQ